jgi:hypothetical protein
MASILLRSKKTEVGTFPKTTRKEFIKEVFLMRDTFKGKARRWFIVGGLLLVMSITSVGYAQVTSLTKEEIDWLTYIREEEKLARDVYLTLYGMYRARIFENISASEQTHMDAIETLLDRYGIPDPAAAHAIGRFTNPDLQRLYDYLVGQGSVSLIQALKVGVFIEKTDIDDLNAAILSTIHKDTKTVYSHLLLGSENHLDAFCSNLVRFKVDCEKDPLVP